MIDGLVVVDKPSGCTSHDVVARLRRIYGQKRVGHAGTLDPGATGVLIVGLGRVTRLLRFLVGADKSYRGRVVLGVSTDTLDADGREVSRVAMPVTRREVEEAAARLTGDIVQVPPMVSAVKVGGRRLHELARQGVEVERDGRLVRIDRFEVTDFVEGDFPQVVIEVECSSGTYVRVLAADLGSALGGSAHLSELRRTCVGGFGLDDAMPLDLVAQDPSAALLPPLAAVGHLPRVQVADDMATAVSHGKRLTRELVDLDSDGQVAVCDSCGVLLAVYEAHRSDLEPIVVLSGGGSG